MDGLIEDNGGAYGVANFSAHVGVYAAELAGILAVGSYLGVTSIGTVPLSHLSTQIVMEINAIAYQGRALLQLYKPIVDSFFKGRQLPYSPQNAAALIFYLDIATRKLQEYYASGYTGPGIQTQLQRIQMILEQLGRWGIR